MATLREIKSRIDSTTKTQQITTAMELVSAAKMSRAEQQTRSYEPYKEKIEEIVTQIAQTNIAFAEEQITHPMLEAREVHKTGYILITSDRGLAGAFNSNVIRNLYRTIQERHESPEEYSIIVIGRIGYEFCQKQNLPISHSILGMSDHPTFADIHDLATEAVQMFVHEEIDELHMVYNYFESAISQKVVKEQLLPITTIEEKEITLEDEYEYEPDQEKILDTLLPQYAENLIFGALLNSKASEHAARMVAMRNATENAEEIIEELTLSYNRARQGAITQEISEIIGGVTALE